MWEDFLPGKNSPPTIKALKKFFFFVWNDAEKRKRRLLPFLFNISRLLLFVFPYFSRYFLMCIMAWKENKSPFIFENIFMFMYACTATIRAAWRVICVFAIFYVFLHRICFRTRNIIKRRDIIFIIYYIHLLRRIFMQIVTMCNFSVLQKNSQSCFLFILFFFL